MVRGRIALALLVAAIGLGHGGGAGAEPTSATAAAEALFQEGRALLIAGKPDEACPKLEESQRQDPATGTLLAVALCHEQQGKLASAWAEFADAEARSRRDGRPDRERTAREHGAALRPRLSTLTLEVPKEVADNSGLVIAVDGVTIGRAAWDTAIPVDGGDRVVAVTVGDGRQWLTTVSVGREQDHVRVPIFMAKRPADRGATTASAGLAKPPPIQAPPTTSAGGGHTMAFALLAAGVAGLGAAAIVAVDARGDYQAAVAMCADGACPPGPYGRAQDARDQGDVATALTVVGATAAVTGVTLWLWRSRQGRGDVSALGRRHLGVSPAGLSISGSF
jgi:hypothetical protein